MTPPDQPPAADNIDAWRDFAHAYLREQLGDDAPAELEQAALFPRSPLEGEGAVAVFRFEARRGAPARASDALHFVVVGQTQPNYYPAYGLSNDDAFSLHLGTRFMLVMGVGQHAPEKADAFDAMDEVRRIVARVSASAPVEDVCLAASFRVEAQVHAVMRARVAGREVYVIGRDGPCGFVEQADLPAPVAYRLHIGRVLRAEPDPAHRP